MTLTGVGKKGRNECENRTGEGDTKAEGDKRLMKEKAPAEKVGEHGG